MRRCGGPLTDSERTKVTAGTRRVLMILYGPPGLPVADLHGAVDHAAALAAAHAGAVVTEQQVVG